MGSPMMGGVYDYDEYACGRVDIDVAETSHFCELIAEGDTNEDGEIVFIGTPNLVSLQEIRGNETALEGDDDDSEGPARWLWIRDGEKVYRKRMAFLTHRPRARPLPTRSIQHCARGCESATPAEPGLSSSSRLPASSYASSSGRLVRKTVRRSVRRVARRRGRRSWMRRWGTEACSVPPERRPRGTYRQESNSPVRCQ